MYTIKTMSIADHDDASWEALFGCADEERRNYKILWCERVIDTHLTFAEAKEMKAYYEAEDMLAADFETEYGA